MLRRFRFTFGVFAASLTLLATSVVLQGAADTLSEDAVRPLLTV